MTVLDWFGHDGVQHWDGGQLRTCRSCQAPALLLDDQGQPQHKTYAEREAGLAPPAADLIRQRPAGPPAAAPVPEPEITQLRPGSGGPVVTRFPAPAVPPARGRTAKNAPRTGAHLPSNPERHCL